ncbi:MAG: CDP-glycerol glycerophosphotransferase family protein [Anaerocolumna sp.]
MKIAYLLYGSLKLWLAKIITLFTSGDVWLVCEKPNEARDNGLYFFKYCMEIQHNHKVFYVVTRNSYDMKNISNFSDNIIIKNSLKHCILYFKASKLISSQALPFPYSEKMCKIIFRVRNQKYFWLQHGITKDKLNHEDMDYSVKEYSLVCCASPREAVFFQEEFGYPSLNAIYTGFCRFDGLIDNSSTHQQILVMPTFRKWLSTKSKSSTPDLEEEDKFKKSLFFSSYSNLLKDKKLIDYLKSNNIQLVFYLHYAFQPYRYLFDECICDNITIASPLDYDVQQLLKESKMLITDYSSVFFDFAYMKKPELFFQFDKNEYRKNHYKEGYFSYEKDGFGPILTDEKSVVDYIIAISQSKYQIEDCYIKRIDSFFPIVDIENCFRIYNLIENQI